MTEQKNISQAATTPPFCTAERARNRREIIAWVLMIECELRGWAERLTVTEFNYLRLCLDDAGHRALLHGSGDGEIDFSNHKLPF